MDRILIEGLRVAAVIGVHPWERARTQPVILDLDVGLDTRNAARSDQLPDTVNYGDIARHVTRLVEASSCELIEALAEQIAASLLAQFPLGEVRLKLAKPGAIPNADQVAVVIHRAAR